MSGVPHPTSVRYRSFASIRPRLEKLEPSAFRRKCGDSYIAGYVEGYKFRGTVSAEKRLLQIAASGEVTTEESFSALVGSGSVSTNIKAKLDSLSNSSKLEVREYTQGGYDSPREAVDLATIRSDYQAFGKTLTKPAWIKIIVARYPQEAVQIQSPSHKILEDNSKLWYEYKRLLDDADAALTKAINFSPFCPTVKNIGSTPVQNLRDEISFTQDEVYSAINSLRE
jgi:hypothetical protein